MIVYVLINVDLNACTDYEPHIYIKVGRSASLNGRLKAIKKKSQSVTTLSPLGVSDYPFGYDIPHLCPHRLYEPTRWTRPRSDCFYASCIYHTESYDSNCHERISPYIIPAKNEHKDVIGEPLDNVEHNKDLYKKRFLVDYSPFPHEHAWVDVSLKSICRWEEYNQDLLPCENPFGRSQKFSIVLPCESYHHSLDEQIAINTTRKFVKDHWHYRIFLYNGLPSNLNTYVNPVPSNLNEVNDDIYQQIGQCIEDKFSKHNESFSHSKEINACFRNHLISSSFQLA